MNILYLYADTRLEWNSSEFRCAIPAYAIKQTKKNHATLAPLIDFQNGLLESTVDKADVLVVQRDLNERVIERLVALRAKGKIIVADLDDAFDKLQRYNVAYAYWKLGVTSGPDQRAMALPRNPFSVLREGIKECHGLTVSSELLMQDWSEFHPQFVPNYIRLGAYVKRPRKPTGQITIGWGGSQGHFGSWTGSGLFAALREVCAAYPQVRVDIVSNNANIFHALDIPFTQKTWHDWHKNSRAWISAMGEWDIALAPYAGAHAERRSLLRFTELAALRLPFVASHVAGMEKARESLQGIFVANSAAGWQAGMIEAISHYAEWREKAKSNYGWAQSLDANKRAGEFLVETYSAIANGSHP